jgi:hypothetical protein
MAALSAGWRQAIELSSEAHAIGQKSGNDVGIFGDLLLRVLFPCCEKLAVSTIMRRVSELVLIHSAAALTPR